MSTMKYVVVFFIIVSRFIETDFTTVTLSRKERIKLLRQEIEDELQRSKDSSSDIPDNNFRFNEKITPILEEDLKKISKKFELRTVKTSYDETPRTTNVSNSQRAQKLRMKKIKIKKPMLIFYRRMYESGMLDQHIKWLQCQDTITPYLTGEKKEFSRPRLLTLNHTAVSRFIHLITVNTTAYNKEEMYSILYQISTLHIKLFQWSIEAMWHLVQVIIQGFIPGTHGALHSFKFLKAGIKQMFASWRLDTTYVGPMLKQARIFRPPCVQISMRDGSTKHAVVKKYTKPDKSTTRCEDDDECSH